MRKSLSIAAIVLAALAIAVLIWRPTWRGSFQPNDVLKPQQRSQSSTAGGVENLEPSLLIAQAKTASAALQATDRIPAERAHDRREARELISSVCLPEYRNPSPQVDRISVIVSKYCSDYADTDYLDASNAKLAELQGQGTRSFVEALIDADGETAAEQGRVVNDLIRFSDSPWEVQAAIQVANERRLPLEIAKEVEFTSDVEKRDALNALAEIQFCRMSNSCQPDSIVSLRACLSLGGCAGPTGLLDVIKLHTSVRAFELGERMSADLARQR